MFEGQLRVERAKLFNAEKVKGEVSMLCIGFDFTILLLAAPKSDEDGECAVACRSDLSR